LLVLFVKVLVFRLHNHRDPKPYAEQPSSASERSINAFITRSVSLEIIADETAINKPPSFINDMHGELARLHESRSLDDTN